MSYDLIRSRLNLSDVVGTKITLKKRGQDHVGLCPFHSEKTPSFTVNDIKQFYYCFGCHEHGDVINFVAKIIGLSYREAAIKLAKDYNIDLPISHANQKDLSEKEEVHITLELALEFYRKNLNQEVLNYLHNRGIALDLINKFEIGFACPLQNHIPLMQLDKAGLIGKKESSIYDVFRDRIIFPIRNSYSKLVGFGGRVFKKDVAPKYLNSSETIVFKKQEILYGEHLVNYKKNQVIIVEGYIDLIKMHSVGFDETVASLGTAINEKQLDKLWQVADEIILCLDGDAAGLKAAKRLIEISLPKIKANKHLYFVILPNNLDPDGVIVNLGEMYMKLFMSQKIPLSKMIWIDKTANKKFNAESMARLEQQLYSYVEKIQDRITAQSYKRFFNQKIWQLNRSKKIYLKPSYPQYIQGSALQKVEACIGSIILHFPDLLNDKDICDMFNKSFSFDSNFEKKVLDPEFEFQMLKSDPKDLFWKFIRMYELLKKGCSFSNR